MTSRPLALLVTAGVCFVIAVLVGWAATSYGVEASVWDATYGTFTYVERPGSEIVLALGGLLALALSAAALLALIRAMGRTSRVTRTG
jgi:hypothetical protein